MFGYFAGFTAFCQGFVVVCFKSVICSTSNGLFQEISQNFLQPFEKKHCKSLAVGLGEKWQKWKEKYFCTNIAWIENAKKIFCENIAWIWSSLAAVRTPSSWLGILMFMNKREKMWDELKQWKGFLHENCNLCYL